MRNGSTACWRVTLSTRVRTAGSIGGQVMWGEVCGPEGERAWGSGGRKRGAHAEDPRLEGFGQGTRGGAHVEHGAHVRDAGRVEVQRLVELVRALPSRKDGMQG